MAHRLFAPIRHSWLVFVAETKRLVSYRAQFWFELILSSAAELLVALALWSTVFTSHDQIGGYTFSAMALYLTVAVFFGQATKGTGVGTFQREVYEGTLTKYLIYPLSVYSYKFGTFLPRSIFAIVQLFIALGLFWLCGYWPEESTLSLFWIAAGLATLFLACLLYFFMLICIESLAFWADQVWALAYALQIAIVFLSGKVIPLELFPTWFRNALEVSPFPYLAYFPARVFLGQMEVNRFLLGLLGLVTWVLASFILSRIIMQRGLYKYTGVGQ